MASPAAENMQNGISTPPATNNAQTLSPPQPASQQQQQPSQQSNGGGSNAPTTNGPSTTTTTTAPTNMHASYPPTSLQDPGTSKRPRDARLIHLILANMGVHAYTERVPLQLLDFAYRYTSSILSDALSYEPPAPTTSASKKRSGGGAGGQGGGEGGDEGISLNALRTAVGARAATTFQSALGKEFMGEVAMERNRIALPRVEREFGVRLPPERYCFTGVGWGVKGAWEEDLLEGEEGEDVDMEDEGEGAGGPGFGGPVGGGAGGVNGGAGVTATGGDTAMGGMDEDEGDDDDEFEEAMGLNQERGGGGGA